MKVTSIKAHGNIIAYNKGCRCEDCVDMYAAHKLARQYPHYRTVSVSSDWRNRALCKGEDVNLFLSSSKEKQAQAIQVCDRCHVKEDCLATAIQEIDVAGIYGGVTEQNRTRAYRLTKRPQKVRV